MELLDELPVSINDRLEDSVFEEAAGFKARYRISLADSIALAETKTRGGILVTADHHEMDAIDKDGLIKFLWIR